MSVCIKDIYDYEKVEKCSKCKTVCLKSIFHNCSLSKDGLHTQCKSCRKTYRRQKFKENYYSELIKQKKYQSENPDKI